MFRCDFQGVDKFGCNRVVNNGGYRLRAITIELKSLNAHLYKKIIFCISDFYVSVGIIKATNCQCSALNNARCKMTGVNEISHNRTILCDCCRVRTVISCRGISKSSLIPSPYFCCFFNVRIIHNKNLIRIFSAAATANNNITTKTAADKLCGSLYRFFHKSLGGLFLDGLALFGHRIRKRTLRFSQFD